jgi:aminoglycoside phosphotransferase (APT) family kinase protein
MAISNITDPAQAQTALTAWLSNVLPTAGDVQVSDVAIPGSSGLSNETLLFSAQWTENSQHHTERYVARVQPINPGVHPRYDLEAEAKLLRAVAVDGVVPVPRVHWYEPAASVLGAPFTVMDYIDGKVPADDPPYTFAGWVLDLSSKQRATLAENALAALAAIHQIDWKRLRLDFLDKPEHGTTGLDQQLGYIAHAYAWTAGSDRNPTIEAAFDWIRTNRPTQDEPLVLNWGDARIGNMLFTEDLAVAAVLDWEMAALASPEMDLGWWLFLQRHHTQGIGAPLPPGLFERDEVISRYQDLTGHEVRHIEFYEIFATLRGAIQMQRTGALMIEAGLLPPDSPIKTCNPANQLLAQLLNLPAPEGIAESWIGNR